MIDLEFLGFAFKAISISLILLILSVFGIVIPVNKADCKNFSEATGLGVKFYNFGGCYIANDDGYIPLSVWKQKYWLEVNER